MRSEVVILIFCAWWVRVGTQRPALVCVVIYYSIYVYRPALLLRPSWSLLIIAKPAMHLKLMFLSIVSYDRGGHTDIMSAIGNRDTELTANIGFMTAFTAVHPKSTFPIGAKR